MKTVLGGLSAAAGPLGIAVAGLTLGLGFLAMKHQEAAQKAQEQALAAQELVDTLDTTTGALTEQSEQWAINEASTNGYLEMARDLDTVMRDWGVSERDIIDALQGKESAVNKVTAAIDAEQDSTRRGIVNGNDYRGALSNLEGQIGANAEALDIYRQSLEDVSRLSQEAQDTQALADAISVLRDVAADADTKLRAYNEALELLQGGTVDVDRANREMYQTFRDVDEALVNSSASAAAGQTVYYDLAGAINTATGQLDQTTEIGGIVADTYDRMREQADRAALAIAQGGGTAQEVMAPYGALRQEFVDLLTTAGATPAQIEAITSSLDNVPDETKAELLLGAEGFEEPMAAAEQMMTDMDGRRALAEIVGNNQPLADKILDARTDLDALSQVVATATADLDPTEANRVYQEVLFMLTGLDEQHPTPQAHLDPAAFDAALAIVDAQIETLASLKPTPEVRANLADWQRKREIVLQNIEDLDAERPTPTVDANPNPFYTHSAAAQRRINELNAQRPTPVVSANASPFYGVAQGVAGRLAAVNASRAAPVVTAQDRASGVISSIIAMMRRIVSKTVTVTTQHVTKGNTIAAAGKIVQAAAGQFREATIAKGGSNILWAEPETGWEAYIPGRLDKRGRAIGILEEVARRFGRAVVPMDSGGFTQRDPGEGRGPLRVRARPSDALPPTIINNFIIDQALIPFEARKYATEVTKQQRRERSIRPRFTG
jgi:tetratricopeptide (TPR) repeat protein